MTQMAVKGLFISMYQSDNMNVLNKHARNNNIGLLRLVLASAVIIGHAPELVDGTRAREPLTRLFGTMSLGEVAVDAFFVLSGFLITKSLANRSSITDFVSRRLLRIYPAFLVAYLLSVYCLGALAGADPMAAGWRPLLGMIVLSSPAYMPSELDSLHYPLFNGAMWTIAYEFRCYLFAALLGYLGVLQRPRILLTLTAVIMASLILTGLPIVGDALIRATENPFITFVTMYPPDMVRFVAAFLVGTCFNLYRESAIRKLGSRTALLGGLVTVFALAGNPVIAETGLLVGGSIVLFWLCFRPSLGVLQHINGGWDISYGTYLYGWPVATALIWMHPQISPWVVACITLPLAWCMGAASWWGIEKPILDWGRIHLSPSPNARSASAQSVATSRFV